jgi:putative cardiolipin synthase
MYQISKSAVFYLIAAVSLSMAGCASFTATAVGARQESHALAGAGGKLPQAFKAPATAKSGDSGFRMISAGIDGLAARLEMIDAAERSLDLQYYIFHNDESGGLIALALLRAADRGVRVRVLVDDGATVVGDENLFALTAHPSIEIRIFSPFDYRGHVKVLRGLDFAFHKRRLDHRMHNKLIVADDVVAVIGGRNIGDQYFQIDPGSQFGDDDVAVAGPMVQRLEGVFDEFWNSDLAIPSAAVDRKHTSVGALTRYRAELAQRRQPKPFQVDLMKRVASGEPFTGIASGRAPLVWAHSQLMYDSPDKGQVVDGVTPGKLIYAPMEDHIKGVKSELLMVTPYFVPSPREMSLLKDGRERNVRVCILTNSLEAAPDVLAHSGYTHYRRSLLDEGAELHEIRALPEGNRGTGQSKAISRRGNYALHAKLYVFDRQSLFIGSMNFDQRSKRLNTEMGIIINSPALAGEAATRFDSLTQLDNAYAVELRGEGKPARPQLVWLTSETGAVREYTREPARSEWQRVKMKFLSLLPLDREL